MVREGETVAEERWRERWSCREKVTYKVCCSPLTGGGSVEVRPEDLSTGTVSPPRTVVSHYKRLREVSVGREPGEQFWRFWIIMTGLFWPGRFAHNVVCCVGDAGIATILRAEVQDLTDKLLHHVVSVVTLLLIHHRTSPCPCRLSGQVLGYNVSFLFAWYFISISGSHELWFQLINLPVRNLVETCLAIYRESCCYVSLLFWSHCLTDCLQLSWSRTSRSTDDMTLQLLTASGILGVFI